MNTLATDWIEEVLGSRWTSPIQNPFTSVSTDTRALTPHSLFIALAGPERHGQEFLSQAKAAGATGAIVEKLQPIDLPQLVVPNSLTALQTLAAARRQQYKGTVISLTGSSGKTTTKELMAHLLGADNCSKTSGNFNNHLGVPLTILNAELAKKFWVIEAGTGSPGEMAPLVNIIRPNAGILTMIGSSHLEFFKTREAIAEEKSQLFSRMGKDEIVVLHEKDFIFPALQKLNAQTIVLTPDNFKLQETADGWTMNVSGQTFKIPDWSQGVKQNAALCVMLARELGIKSSDIQERLLSWRAADLRGQWVRYHSAPATQRIYLDAYNCSPEALIDSFGIFERLSRRQVPRLFVLSAMSELGEDGVKIQMNAASKIPLLPHDRVALVGGGTEAVIAGLKLAGLQESQLTSCKDVDEVKTILKTFAGDCFIKGSHYGSRLFTLAKECTRIE